MRHLYLVATSSVALLSACVGLARYDDNTFKSMTALKGEVKVFMDDCAAKGASGEKALAALEGFRVKISQSYEYEAGKGSNNDTTAQMKELNSFFNEAYTKYSTNKMSGAACTERPGGEQPDHASGCLTAGYCKGKSKVVETAFDIAISTEALKNK